MKVRAVDRVATKILESVASGNNFSSNLLDSRPDLIHKMQFYFHLQHFEAKDILCPQVYTMKTGREVDISIRAAHLLTLPLPSSLVLRSIASLTPNQPLPFMLYHEPQRMSGSSTE
jgi:hypothetical protein